MAKQPEEPSATSVRTPSVPREVSCSTMAIGGLPEVKQTIIDMRLNASGVHDTARSLHICTNIVLRELKKKAPMLESVHPSLLHTLNPTEVTWDLERAGEAEMDARWSFVGNKGNPRWLWHAIDHHPGEVLAYGFGRPQGTVFLKLTGFSDASFQ